MPPHTIQLTKDKQKCEDLFAQTHYRDDMGCYVVRLPVAATLPDLAESRSAAERMLRQMEDRFSRDRMLHAKYSEFMRKYETLQHMTPVAPLTSDKRRACFLPHHRVWKETNSAAKLRVVFNGS